MALRAGLHSYQENLYGLSKCEPANKLSTLPSVLLGNNLKAFGNKSVREKWKSHTSHSHTTKPGNAH